MERAYALRDTREKQRQELVNQKYAQQWRDSCDDARTLDSKATTLFMNQERLRQIREKMEMKKQLSSQENDFLAEWTRQLEEIERREKEKEYNHLLIEKETAAEVRRQMELNQKKKEQYYADKLREEQEELFRVSIQNYFPLSFSICFFLSFTLSNFAPSPLIFTSFLLVTPTHWKRREWAEK